MWSYMCTGETDCFFFSVLVLYIANGSGEANELNSEEAVAVSAKVVRQAA